MASLEGVLGAVPGYGGYLARRGMIEDGNMDAIRQASGIVSLEGALQQRAQQQRTLEREQAFRTELAAAGDDLNAQARVASRFAAPADVLRTNQAALDRQASVQARLEERKMALDAAAQNAALSRQEREQARQASDALRIQLAQMQDETRRSIAGQSNETRRLLLEQRTNSERKPPANYQWSSDGTRLEAIPGGPADLKIQGQFNADTAALQSSENALSRLEQAANEVLNHPGLGRITGLMGKVPNIPGYPGADAAAKLEQLKSQAGFAVLQTMRDASKTGGALGNVSNFEVQQLQNNLAALQTAQSEEQLRSELEKIMAFTQGSRDRLRQAYNMRHGVNAGNQAAPAPSPSPAPIVKPPSQMTNTELMRRREELLRKSKENKQ